MSLRSLASAASSAIVAVLPLISHAQSDQSAFTLTGIGIATTMATDYHAVGINPANLGRPQRYEGKRITFGLVEPGFSFYSGALHSGDFRERVLGSDYRFTPAERDEAAMRFANENSHFQLDATVFGFAYQHEKIGGFGFRISDQLRWDSRFSPRLSQLLFEGHRSDYFDLLVLATGDTVNNYSGMSIDSLQMVVRGVASEPQYFGRLANGSHLHASWIRSYAFSYGRSIVHSEGLDLHIGIGLRYLQGFAIADVRARNNNLTAFSALSRDFGVTYTNNGVEDQQGRSFAGIATPRPVGTGFGYDFGVSATLKERWHIAASVVNLGSMRWSGEVHRANDAALVDLTSAGLDSYNFVEGLGEVVTESSLLEWSSGAQQTTALPATARFGTSYRINKTFELGVDAVWPLDDNPGSMSAPMYALGSDIAPAKWVRFGLGVMTGGGYPVRIPVGITFVAGNGTWEAGVASRDAITYLADRSPVVSLAMGFLRFRI